MSKDLYYDGLLISARPHNVAVDAKFTDRVMNTIAPAEIMTTQMRSMNVTKKETFIMKLHHLPKFAVVAIALGALVLLSSTAYATYQLLWGKPSVELNQLTTSQSGREEALLSTKDCGKNSTQRYELKKNATITADRIAAVVRAQCELKAIDTWAQNIYGQSPLANPGKSSSYEHTSARVSMATHLKEKQKDSLTFAENTKYGQPEVSFKTSPTVKYIVNGKEASASDINTGDVVAYVLTSKTQLSQIADGSYNSNGMSQETFVAVVKLTMPFEDYDQFAWQSLSERQSCNGNPDELCIGGGASIDLYMGGGTNGRSGGMMKQIQGVVTEINGKTVSLRASSGKIYRVTTPTDVIRAYNDTKASKYYNNQKVTIGSTLSADYYEAENEHATDVTASYLYFMIELVSKGDPVKAY